jgi:hypothetical protein
MVVVTKQLQPVLIVSPAPFCRKSNLMFTTSAGFKVMQIRLVFLPVMPLHSNTLPPVFFYSKFFKFSGQHRANVDGNDVFAPAPNVDMFLLHRHFRTGGTTHVGDIIRLTDVREILKLVLVYGSQMDLHLDWNMSLDLTNTFYMNNFASKETFHAILTYQ